MILYDDILENIFLYYHKMTSGYSCDSNIDHNNSQITYKWLSLWHSQIKLVISLHSIEKYIQTYKSKVFVKHVLNILL